MSEVDFRPGQDGKVSSTETMRAVMETSAAAVDLDAAKAVAAEKDWRNQYNRHFCANLALGCQSDAAAFAIAEAGLAAARAAFTITEAMQPGPGAADKPLRTVSVHGAASAAPARELTIPYKGKALAGKALEAQIKDWESRGVMEPSCGMALRAVSAHAGAWCDLRGQAFAVLGAGTQMGPTVRLLEMGATVLAVDLPRAAIWARLTQLAAHSPGTLLCPTHDDDIDDAGDPHADRKLGCNLLADTRQIANWIVANAGVGPLTVGVYCYLDGALFTRVAIACDAIIEHVCATRSDTRLAFLCSPTETFTVPAAAMAAADHRYSEWALSTIWHAPVAMLSRNRYLEKQHAAATVGDVNVVDFYVASQGPNYAFAKQMQRWRSVIARSKGHLVSTTIGPATVTESVIHNRIIAAGMYGCAHFGIEPFEPDTSNAVLAAILVSDLHNDAAAANPKTKLATVMDLFSENACHGGTFRVAYKTNSYTEVSALVYLVKAASPYVTASAGLLGALAFARATKPKL